MKKLKVTVLTVEGTPSFLASTNWTARAIDDVVRRWFGVQPSDSPHNWRGDPVEDDAITLIELAETAADVINMFDQANTGNAIVGMPGNRGSILNMAIEDLRAVVNSDKKRTILTKEQAKS